MRPIKLRADNWTPPAKTPWGGRAIAERWKAGLAIDPEKAAWPAIGESWELSFDPLMPSRAEDGKTLAEHVAADPEAWLGRDAGAAALARSLLVKLLDTRERLSLQVHPADDDPALAPDESGKPEAWVVLSRAPGAGLWLGFADGVSRDDVARAVAAGGAGLEALLNFVPVEPGDAFVIEAGTVHAIGPGVTLLEPQLVRPGRTGVTYRFWDWGRRYDAAGRLDARGAPRPLHLERSLAVTAWDAARGAELVAACRREPEQERLGAATLTRYFELKGMHLWRWQGSGRVSLPARDVFTALVVTEGALSLGGVGASAGETLAVPAACHALELVLDGASAFVFAPGPAGVAEAGQTC